MKITLDLSELEIKAMHNAAAALGHEASAIYLGCNSWMKEKFQSIYPVLDSFELEDIVSEQAKAIKELVLKIEKIYEEEQNNGH